MVPSLALLNKNFPSGENASPQISYRLPRNVLTSSQVAVLQKLIVESALAEASVFPSGENASELTHAV